MIFIKINMFFPLQLSHIISNINTSVYPITAEFYTSKGRDKVAINVSLREYLNCGEEINLATYDKQGDPYTKLVNYYEYITPGKPNHFFLPDDLEENTYYYIMSGDIKNSENYSLCYIKRDGKWKETDATEEQGTGNTGKKKNKSKTSTINEEESNKKPSKNNKKKENQVTSNNGGDMNIGVLFICIGVLGFIMIALSIVIHFCR